MHSPARMEGTDGNASRSPYQRHTPSSPIPEVDILNRLPPFLQKTWEMVNDPNNADIIAWEPDGETFTVLKHEELARYVLSKHFKHQNFNSFVRQLHTYGFKKVDSKAWRFRNENFVRGNISRLRQIERRAPERKTRDQTDGSTDDERVVPTSYSPMSSLAQTINDLTHSITALHETTNFLREHLRTLYNRVERLERLEQQKERSRTVRTSSLPTTSPGMGFSFLPPTAMSLPTAPGALATPQSFPNVLNLPHPTGPAVMIPDTASSLDEWWPRPPENSSVFSEQLLGEFLRGQQNELLREQQDDLSL